MTKKIESKADAVRRILTDSLFRDNEVVDGKPTAESIIVHGIRCKFGFHKARLESHRNEVLNILKKMNDKFKAKGGGWTFLNLCSDIDGELWAEQVTCDELVSLAIGLGLGKIQLPREVWPSLPGGVPYIVFNI